MYLLPANKTSNRWGNPLGFFFTPSSSYRATLHALSYASKIPTPYLGNNFLCLSHYYTSLTIVQTLPAPSVLSTLGLQWLAPSAVGALSAFLQLPLKCGRLTHSFSTLCNDQHEGVVSQQAPNTQCMCKIPKNMRLVSRMHKYRNGSLGPCTPICIPITQCNHPIFGLDLSVRFLSGGSTIDLAFLTSLVASNGLNWARHWAALVHCALAQLQPLLHPLDFPEQEEVHWWAQMLEQGPHVEDEPHTIHKREYKTINKHSHPASEIEDVAMLRQCKTECIQKCAMVHNRWK